MIRLGSNKNLVKRLVSHAYHGGKQRWWKLTLYQGRRHIAPPKVWRALVWNPSTPAASSVLTTSMLEEGSTEFKDVFVRRWCELCLAKEKPCYERTNASQWNLHIDRLGDPSPSQTTCCLFQIQFGVRIRAQSPGQIEHVMYQLFRCFSLPAFLHDIWIKAPQKSIWYINALNDSGEISNSMAH